MTDEFLDPNENAAELAKLNAASKSEFPIIDPGKDNLVNLPGGYRKKGKIVRKGTVRELTGADEELIAKATRSGNMFHFIDTILHCGVEDIDSDTMDTMLVGDRDALLLGIRAATYGPEIEFNGYQCPFCGERTDLEFDVTDIPVVRMEDPANEMEFEVELKKGRVAKVRLANNEDQSAVMEKENLTGAERDSILLSRCVMSIDDKDGNSTNIAAFPSAVREMPLMDRRKILNELVTRQPGPKFDQITFKHEACGNEVALEFDLGDLFPGLA